MASSSSTLLRRCISSSSQFFRSRTLSTAVGGGGVTAPPWLMLTPSCDIDDDIVFRFQCCAKTKVYSFYYHHTDHKIRYQELAGSSHGWLALSSDLEKRNLFLTDPTTKRHVKLPLLPHAMGGLRRIILSGREGKAFVIYGEGRGLAFCSPQQSGGGGGWAPFGADDGAYESIVYSSSHRRLFCLTSTLRLEAWDVAGEPPSLDWSTQFEVPDHLHKPGLTTLMYLVCWEASGDLFVVVRRVDPSRGRFVEVGADSEFAHRTVGFEVYKVDREGRRVARMESSLEGLTMFVGMNHPFAIKGVEGVKPNAIYFGYEEQHDGVRDFLYDYDYGIFDYQKRCVSLCGNNYLAEFYVSEPIWFVPHR